MCVVHTEFVNVRARVHACFATQHLQTFHLVYLSECLAFLADGCSLGSAVHSVTIALRHFALGVDPTAAYWDFDLLDGHGGWRAEGCHITGSGGNTTTIHCTHHNNFAVLMVSSLLCGTRVIHFSTTMPTMPLLLRAYYGSNASFFPPWNRWESRVLRSTSCRDL